MVFCASISHKEFLNEQKCMDYNAISLGKTSLILMTMSKKNLSTAENIRGLV